LVTGVSGQDGSYLAELLLAQGRRVVGTVRPGSNVSDYLPSDVDLIPCDLGDHAGLEAVIKRVQPMEIYHLAAPTFVPESWEDPTTVLKLIPEATSVILTAARHAASKPRVFLASSAEIFGDTTESPQTESSPKNPTSPYGVAKLAAFGLARAMREHHGQFVVNGILFNHESPRRPERFLPRKVSLGVAAIKAGKQDQLELGDLGTVRDWSHARDIMAGAILAIEADRPDDYILASGVGHSVQDLVDAGFRSVGLDSARYLKTSAQFQRRKEAVPMTGDSTKARQSLGWTPQVSFDQLIEEMVASDLAAATAT